MTEARPTVSLYDTDGSFLADLPLAAGVQWRRETSAPGAVSFKLPIADSATALVTARRIVKVHWRGAFQQAAKVAGSKTDVAVEGNIWREWSNLPGMLSCLATVPILPEYGLDRASNSQRTFGYPARDGSGEWLSSGNFTAAEGVRWSAMTGARASLPAGLDYPNPYWIAKRGPDFDEPANLYQYYRRVFTTADRQKVQILATGDNYLDLWLDGEQIVASDTQNPFTWREAFQVPLRLPAGQHTLAARVRNGPDSALGIPNHMGFIFTMQAVDTAGNVIPGAPIVNSDTDWVVSDVAPGFRRADVLFREWVEASSYFYTDVDLMPLGFTRTHDSAGVAWADDPAEYTVDVSSPVLDLISTFTEKDADVLVDPDTLHLNMWNRLGSDLSATVQLRTGSDGGGLMSHPVERVEPVFNTVLAQLADGRWVQRQNAAQVAAEGRHGVGLAAGGTSDAASGNHLADAQLADAALPVITFAAQLSSQVGPQPGVDFDLGDSIAVPDEDATGTYKARLMAVTCDASADGPVQITLDLMHDRSGTTTTLSSGGAGTGDPGDLEAGP